jgi:MoaA/NifB/PqqE/SkfB family radical SAM enzyme
MSTQQLPTTVTNGVLDFLWLEVTPFCNMECVHCYADSGSNPKMKSLLSPQDYLNLIKEAARMECRKIQFIGGEPTLVKHLPDYISYARQEGFEFIEVFTNAFVLSERSLTCFVEHNVSLATSFYCDIAEIHDAITQRLGSHNATTTNIKRILDAGLKLRVGIIEMPQNQHRIKETKEFLYKLGVQDVGSDRIRGIGRGGSLDTHKAGNLSELCGSCWNGTACIAPDGTVSPCIMSKNWSKGSVLEASLEQIVRSCEFREIRQQIFEEVWRPLGVDVIQGIHTGERITMDCSPDCSPKCVPDRACYPTTCSPNKNCQPDGCYPCRPY